MVVKTKLLIPFFIGLMLMLHTSCNFINPVERKPTYIRIDSFQFANVNPGANGSPSHKITSAWVYFNNQPVGVFDIPGTIPVLADGPGQLSVNPGVTYSGMKNTQVLYPYYTFDSISIVPSNGGVIPYTPKTQYSSSANFLYKEDFEVGNTFLETNSADSSDTSLIRVTDKSKVFEGAASGYIYLNQTRPNSENISTTAFLFTAGQSQAYLELNYNCSVDFVVGLEITGGNGTIYTYYVAGAKANETWNKLYIGLADIISTYASYYPIGYRVMIKSVLPAGATDGYVLLDNIKVVSF